MENLEVCAMCGGVCCKRCGCHFSPEDFEVISFESLKKEIDKGFISIDWWEGNPFENDERDIKKAYFLRMRNINSPIVDPTWGGVCMLLKEDGCPLSYEERPKGARLLEPVLNGSCIMHYGKDECARDWFKYDDILKKLVRCYEVIWRGLI